eukprot:GDKJ01056068.1.p1 GENE.GDKJ01056068.1~~GDKJ01056068.1.p1  ORF type:complete len:880 (+),score=192.57 GDKJ01056068.1:176-2641(+)
MSKYRYGIGTPTGSAFDGLSSATDSSSSSKSLFEMLSANLLGGASSSSSSSSGNKRMDVIDLFDVSMEEAGAPNAFRFLEATGGLDTVSDRPRKLAQELKILRFFWRSVFNQDSTRSYEKLLSLKRGGDWSEEWFKSAAGRALLEVAKDGVYQIVETRQQVSRRKVWHDEDKEEEDALEEEEDQEDQEQDQKKRRKVNASKKGYTFVRSFYTPIKYPEMFRMIRSYNFEQNLTQNHNDNSSPQKESNRVRVLIMLQDDYTVSNVTKMMFFGHEKLSESSYKRLIADLVVTTGQQVGLDEKSTSMSTATGETDELSLDLEKRDELKAATSGLKMTEKAKKMRRIEYELLKKELKRLTTSSSIHNADVSVCFRNKPPSPRELGVILESQRTEEERQASAQPQVDGSVNTELEVFIRAGVHGDELHAHAHDIQPHVIILAEPILGLMRACEFYAITAIQRKGVIPHIWTFAYANGPDQREFAVSVHAEFSAWQSLSVSLKSLILSDQDGILLDEETKKRINSMTLHLNPDLESKTGITSRNAALLSTLSLASKIVHRPTVVIDVRELNSELPCSLYKSSIQIVPLTLKVGDYVLTPDIVVERKSIPDLQQSLPQGRLLSQALKMQRHYSRCFLLIEVDAKNLLMSTSGNASLSAKMMSAGGGVHYAGRLEIRSILSHLVLFTIHFPAVKIIWSLSSSHTVQMFTVLKRGKEQPDAQAAALMGSSTATAENNKSKVTTSLNEKERDNTFISSQEEDELRDAAISILKSIPGVTARAASQLERLGGSLRNLSLMSQEELTKIAGNAKSAEAVYNFFNSRISVGTQL